MTPFADHDSRTGYSYDVALSFAGEQRPYVEGVAEGCRQAGIRVFYDTYEMANLWGKDLYQHLDWVYSAAARYCVVFISDDYVAKAWSTHEQRSAQERAFRQNSEYILPVIFDGTRAPGLPSTVGYVDARAVSPKEVVRLIERKLDDPPRGGAPSAGEERVTPTQDDSVDGTVHNWISGVVLGDVIQARDVTARGGLHLGRYPRPDR